MIYIYGNGNILANVHFQYTFLSYYIHINNYTFQVTILVIFIIVIFIYLKQ